MVAVYKARIFRERRCRALLLKLIPELSRYCDGVKRCDFSVLKVFPCIIKMQR